MTSDAFFGQSSSLPADNGPCVHIVVVTYNSRAHFEALQNALLSQTVQAFAVTIWDNASKPEQRPSRNDFPPNARIVLSSDNIGFAAANNRAVSTGPRTEFVALLNPDAFPEPDWLETLLAAAARWPHAASFGSTQLAADDPGLYDGLGDCYHVAGIPWRAGYRQPRNAPPPSGECFSACAAAALYRRDAWDAAGGFDEWFFCYGEDVDLGFRLRLMGYGCVQVGEATVRHVGGASAGRRSAFADRHAARNRLWTFLKCMPCWTVWVFLPAHLVATVILLMGYAASGRGFAGWRGFIEGVGGAPRLLAARRRVQKSRTIALSSVMAAMAWSPVAMLRRAPVLRNMV